MFLLKYFLFRGATAIKSNSCETRQRRHGNLSALEARYGIDTLPSSDARVRCAFKNSPSWCGTKDLRLSKRSPDVVWRVSWNRNSQSISQFSFHHKYDKSSRLESFIRGVLSVSIGGARGQLRSAVYLQIAQLGYISDISHCLATRQIDDSKAIARYLNDLH